MGVMEAYCDRKFAGNIADLCDNNLGRRMPEIKNQKLDGLISEIFNSTNSYKQVCCRYLDRIRI